MVKLRKYSLIKRLWIPLLLLILISGVFTGGALLWQVKSEISRVNLEQAKSIEASFRYSLNKDAEIYQSLIQRVKDNIEITRAFAERDQQRLLALSAPLFSHLNKDFRVTHFYFHLPDRYNFLRVHKPEKAGDFIDRTTLQEAVSLQKDFWGVEIGIFGWHVLRVVSPWYVDGKLIGYLELGEEINHLIQGTNELYGVNTAILLSKSRLNEARWNEINPNAHYGWNTLNDFVVESTNGQALKPAVMNWMLDISYPTTVSHYAWGQGVYWLQPMPILSADGRVHSWLVPIIELTDFIEHQVINMVSLLIGFVMCWGGLLYFLVMQTRKVERELDQANYRLGQEREEKLYAQAMVEQQARFDGLTGLPNRQQFTTELAQTLKNISRFEYGAVVFIDLDHFKFINDSMGHGVGDYVINTVAARIKSILRGSDYLARFGGDEFVLLLREFNTSAYEARQLYQNIANKLIALFDAPLDIRGVKHHVTASFGISCFPSDSKKAEELLQYADAAMNEAKKLGRNRAVFFEASLQDALSYRMRLEAEMRPALQNHQFFLVFQPKYTHTGGIAGAEVLVRWQHPKLGLIPPTDFIAIAEETSLIHPLSDWIMREALISLRKLCETGAARDFALSINISPVQFRQQDFVEKVTKLVDEVGIPAGNLVLEITEGLLIDDIAETKRKLLALKARNIQISIDDFGTGYSSLSYLQQLPIDELKIDRSFVADILPEKGNTGIVEAILSMGKHLGLRIVAEGVEQAHQQAFLQSHQCYLYQGFYYSKPVPLATLGSMLALQSSAGSKRELPTK